MAADGVPAEGDGIRGLSAERHTGFMQALVDADKGVAAGVEAADLAGAGEEGVVAEALAVFGLVVDGPAFHLHLADGVGALVVGHVVERFEEAELLIGEELEPLFLAAPVAEGDLPELQIFPAGHEEKRLAFEALALGP